MAKDIGSGVFVPRFLFEDRRTSMREKSLIALMMHLSDDNRLTIDKETLAGYFGKSRGTIGRALKALEIFGYINNIGFDGRNITWSVNDLYTNNTRSKVVFNESWFRLTDNDISTKPGVYVIVEMNAITKEITDTLYIGSSKNMKKRVEVDTAHPYKILRNKYMNSKEYSIGIYEFIANNYIHVESMLIQKYIPKYNKSGVNEGQ